MQGKKPSIMAKEALACLRFLYGTDAVAERVIGVAEGELYQMGPHARERATAHLAELKREMNSGLAALIATVHTIQSAYDLLAEGRTDAEGEALEAEDRINDAREHLMLSKERLLRRYVAPLQDVRNALTTGDKT